MDSWTQTLKDDVAKLHDLDAQGNNMTKVIDLADELVKIVWPPWFTTISGCILTILIRVAALREITSMSFSSSALSIHTVSKRRRCPGLAWVQMRCAQY